MEFFLNQKKNVWLQDDNNTRIVKPGAENVKVDVEVHAMTALPDRHLQAKQNHALPKDYN